MGVTAARRARRELVVVDDVTDIASSLVEVVAMVEALAEVDARGRFIEGGAGPPMEERLTAPDG